jgi:hypothetical protein
MGSDDFGMSVSCTRHVSDVCPKLAPISCSLSSVSTRRFLAGFLSRSDPLNLNLEMNEWVSPVLEIVFQENL